METTPISPPPGSALWQLERVAKSDAFVRDARRLVGIPESAFSAALAEVNTAQGFMGLKTLSVSIAAHVPDSGQIDALTNFLINLASLRRQADPDEHYSERAASIIERALEEKLEPLQLQTFVNRLPALLLARPPIERQLKAEEISERTGTTLEALHLVCDLRPVFDEAGASLEGLIPVTTLHIEYDASGTTHVCDVRLSERQVAELAKDVERAQSKLRALRSFIRTSGLPTMDTFSDEGTTA